MARGLMVGALDPFVEQAEAVVGVAADLGFGDLEVRESYSGRFMFGERVAAISGSEDDVGIFMAIGVLLERGEVEASACRWFGRRDQMGLGWVRY